MELHITQQDRDNERRIADFLEYTWCRVIILTPDVATVDAFVTKDLKITGALEIKQRPKYDSLNMDFFYIDKQKLDEISRIGDLLGVNTALIIEDMNDRLLMLQNPNSNHYNTTSFTRDREFEKPDIICLIPSNSWKVLSEFQCQSQPQSSSLPWE